MMRFLLAVLVLSVTGTAAYAQSCEQLWYERNAIYKGAGYCFKTPQAISSFGNAGCRYDVEAEVPLSQDQRERIAYLTRMEQQHGCR